MRIVQLLFALFFLVIVSVGGTHAQDEELAGKAFIVFREFCAECHGETNPNSGLSLLSHAALLDSNPDNDIPDDSVVPKKPEESPVYLRMTTQDEALQMPPEGERQPSAAQTAIIFDWISAGAPPFPPNTILTRPRVTIKAEFNAIAADLRSIPAPNRSDIRYFSISHLHNNPRVTDNDLKLFRAALSKLINSLSWRREIVVPEPVNDEETLFRVNLAEVGWDKTAAWDKLLSHKDETGKQRLYPYGLVWNRSSDAELQSVAQSVYDELGTTVPVIRADWFVANASVGELYYQILDLPKTATELEAILRVDIQRDFLKNLFLRAGFIKSNVSNNNRIVDRYSSIFGAYWRSWDFKSNEGLNDIMAKPLGPDFEFNAFKKFAFQADGGEMIFHLPNGLQAYFLVDGKGDRIIEGPIPVVEDKKSPLGTPVVTNAVSCMACHAEGMQPFQDAIATGHFLTDTDATVKLRLLLGKKDQLTNLVRQDKEQFKAALSKAISPFIEETDVFSVSAEPIAAITRTFSQNVDLIDIIAELGYAGGPDAFKAKLNAPEARFLQLRPILARGGEIQRASWENRAKTEVFFSRYQEAAQLFDNTVVKFVP